jgi:hypothetical protein
MPDRTRQVAENLARYTRLAEHVARLSITETSPDGTVSVTVSANGVLTDLALREQGGRAPLPVIADEIMDCLRRAQARIPDLLRQAMSDIVGDGEPSLLVDEAARRFPPPPPREAPQWQPEEIRIVAERAPEPAVRRPRRPQPREEDDWDERPVMRDS